MKKSKESLLKYIETLITLPDQDENIRYEMRAFLSLYKRYTPDNTCQCLFEILAELCLKVNETSNSRIRYFLCEWMDCCWNSEYRRKTEFVDKLFKFAQLYLSNEELNRLKLAFIRIATKKSLSRKHFESQNSVSPPSVGSTIETNKGSRSTSRARTGRRSSLSLTSSRGISQLGPLPSLQDLQKTFVWEHPELLASALTTITWKEFEHVSLGDLLSRMDQNSNSKHSQPDSLEKTFPSPSSIRSSHLNILTQNFNHVSSWVASEIVLENSNEKRLVLVQYFIDLAERLVEVHNNYHDGAAVVSALNNSSILRLKAVWTGLKEKYCRKFVKLDSLFSPNQNFLYYRTIIKSLPSLYDNNSTSRPVVPYIPLFCKDIISINENSDWIPTTSVNNNNENSSPRRKNNNSLSPRSNEQQSRPGPGEFEINRRKLQLFGQQLQLFDRFQKTGGIAAKSDEYPFGWKQFLNSVEVLTDDYIYAKSLICEPFRGNSFIDSLASSEDVSRDDLNRTPGSLYSIDPSMSEFITRNANQAQSPHKVLRYDHSPLSISSDSSPPSSSPLIADRSYSSPVLERNLKRQTNTNNSKRTAELILLQSDSNRSTLSSDSERSEQSVDESQSSQNQSSGQSYSHLPISLSSLSLSSSTCSMLSSSSSSFSSELIRSPRNNNNNNNNNRSEPVLRRTDSNHKNPPLNNNPSSANTNNTINNNSNTSLLVKIYSSLGVRICSYEPSKETFEDLKSQIISKFGLITNNPNNNNNNNVNVKIKLYVKLKKSKKEISTEQEFQEQLQLLNTKSSSSSSDSDQLELFMKIPNSLLNNVGGCQTRPMDEIDRQTSESSPIRIAKGPLFGRNRLSIKL